MGKSKKDHNSIQKQKFKNLRDSFSFFHLRYAETKFQGSTLNGVARSVGHRQTDRQTDTHTHTHRHTDIQVKIGNHLKLWNFRFGVSLLLGGD